MSEKIDPARKLDWAQVGNEEHATLVHNEVTYRIRAIHDESPENPFTCGDCNWPIVIRLPDRNRSSFVAYLDGCEDRNPSFAPFSEFNDHHLVHDQHAIARALGCEHVEDIWKWFTNGYEDPCPRYIHDADLLREMFERHFDTTENSDKLETLKNLFELIGVKCHLQQVTGYSQGDWCEVLVVASKSAREKFGTPDELVEGDLALTAKLYGWWAYGDCYGYVVERRTGTGASIFLDEGGAQELLIANFPDLEAAEDFLATSATINPDLLEAGDYSVVDYEDPDANPWEETSSCWGYYGPHDQSGLEDAVRADIFGGDDYSAAVMQAAA